jgi:hypothetical protein
MLDARSTIRARSPRDEVRLVEATDRRRRRMKKLLCTRAGSVLLAALSLAWLAAPAVAAEHAPAEPEGGKEPSLSDVNKALTNPVSDIWSITFQQNNFVLKHQLPDDLADAVVGDTKDGSDWNSNLLFQPVLPVGISEDWNLITRPVIPLFVSQPHPNLNVGSGDFLDIDRVTAFGDITLMQLVSPTPKLVGHWLLGAGPTWIFPSGGSDFTGFGKYQVGPAAIAGYLSEKWIAGALVQNWWSFAGDGDRASTNSMNLQPFFSYFLPEGWSAGYSGNVLADWKANDGDVWTVPIGASIAKVVKLGKLPVRLALAGQYMPIHPDQFGQKWNIQVTVAPVLPKLIKGYLSDPRHMTFGLGR